MPKITILDGRIANPNDLSWNAIAQQGTLTVYDKTPLELVVERAKDTHILVANKSYLGKDTLKQLPHLQCICTLATGYNNIDVKAASELGITVCNAVGYSTPSVAQHVFSLLLELTNQVGLHNISVQNKEWTKSKEWCYWKTPLIELAGKIMGIYGYGKIGQQVADIALAFGMSVIVVRKSNTPPENKKVKLVTLEQLFQESDVLSLHAPLTTESQGIINKKQLSLMKKTAYLINTGRGGLVNEPDLKEALEKGQIAGAGLDVLSQEPPPNNHLLLGLSNCIITPHQAWAARASRARLIQIVADNIKAFIAGTPQNVVNAAKK